MYTISDKCTINDEGLVPISELPVITEKVTCFCCGKEDIEPNMRWVRECGQMMTICPECDELPTCQVCLEKVRKNEPQKYLPVRKLTYHKDCYDSICKAK